MFIHDIYHFDRLCGSDFLVILVEFGNDGYFFTAGKKRKANAGDSGQFRSDYMNFNNYTFVNLDKDLQEFTNFRFACLNLLVETTCTGNIERAQNLYCILTALETKIWPVSLQRRWADVQELDLWRYFISNISVSIGYAIYQDKMYLKQSSPELSVHYSKDTGLLIIDDWNVTIDLKAYYPEQVAIRSKKSISLL